MAYSWFLPSTCVLQVLDERSGWPKFLIACLFLTRTFQHFCLYISSDGYVAFWQIQGPLLENTVTLDMFPTL